MKGIILAGGFGTRLRPLTVNVPKPMVPIGNVPCMERVVRLLVKHGVTEILSLLHFQPEAITSHFGDGARFGCLMTYSSPPDDLGTAGAVRAAAEAIDDDFIVVSGDVATDFDLGAAIRFHAEKKALATIVLTRVENPLQYGVVIVDDDGRVRKFLEKPTWGEVFSDLINTGIYVFRREILSEIPPGASFDFSKDLYPKILAAGRPLYGHTAEGYWRDIGTIEQYVAAHRDLLAGSFRTDLPGRGEVRAGGSLWLGESVRVAATATIRGTVLIGDGAVVEEGAEIENTCIGDGALVGRGAHLTGAILWRNARIGPHAEVREDAVIAEGAVVEAKAAILAGAIVSDGSTVGADATVNPGVKIWPGKWVDPGATVHTSVIWGDRWASSLFGFHGVSGIPNLEFTPEFGARLGAAYGASLGKGAVVYASRDAHRASRIANRAMICGLLSVGVNVRDLREMPIPVVRYNIRTHQAAGGLHARISPYDPRLLDVKVFDADGMNLPARREKAVENLFFREDFPRAQADESGGLYFPARALEHYREGFLAAIDREAIRSAGFKVLLDYSNGTTTHIFPSILADLGAEVISLNAFIDERRLARPPEALQEQIERAGEICRGARMDVGFVIEPGGERVRMVDASGRPLDDQTVSLMTARLAIDAGILGGRKVAAPVTASGALLDVCAAAGVEVVWTPTSHPAMMATAARKDVGLLVYPRGGVIFPNFLPAFDGMFAVAKILELLARVARPLGGVLSSLPPHRILHEEVRTPWERKGYVMRALIEAAKGDRTDLIDGVKVWRGRSWTLALPDADRPCFHIYAEADDEATARRALAETADLVRARAG